MFAVTVTKVFVSFKIQFFRARTKERVVAYNYKYLG